MGHYHRSLVLAELFPAPAFALLPVTYAVRLRLAPFPALARRPERRFVVAVEHIEITRHTVQNTGSTPSIVTTTSAPFSFAAVSADSLVR